MRGAAELRLSSQRGGLQCHPQSLHHQFRVGNGAAQSDDGLDQLLLDRDRGRGQCHQQFGHLPRRFAGPYWPANAYLTGSLAGVVAVPAQLSAASISLLNAAASTGALTLDISQLGPSGYWPLQDSASNVCGTVEVTVQQTVGTTNTCIYPAGTGACPSPSSSYLLPGLASRSVTAPTSSAAVAVKIAMEENATSGTSIAGLHVLPNVAFGTGSTANIWFAQVDFPYAVAHVMSLFTQLAHYRRACGGPAQQPATEKPNRQSRHSRHSIKSRHSGEGAFALVALVVVVLAVGAALAWRLPGGRLLVMATPSMCPAVCVGSLVADQPLNGALHTGELISFHAPGSMEIYTHKVSAILRNGMIQTRGIANPTHDPWLITRSGATTKATTEPPQLEPLHLATPYSPTSNTAQK